MPARAKKFFEADELDESHEARDQLNELDKSSQ